ncbi:sulfite exporter TauE/SafE family protein [Pullulanibacillus sp. KACC 23026]|uniref:sulfite exporter TauE/SafE family protein n=1 Tax=Pullulanibacillus sp. KACC 23026 TaxID=3028315 RepID=UPI0023B10809|nr:sulfite exporter TauE/SafE family protein [Pullulanibacillus sp. KACC 23026]WEG11885.1 sulfite exporter TauE/SafE family protein [Pullulanibacillus sp. KACC 23026]
MTMTTSLILLLIGIFAGGYGTIVGAGGGFIYVPALLLIFHMQPSVAAGCGLVIVLINSLSGVFGYARQKRIDYRTGIALGFGALPGSLLGVWLLQVYSSNYFYIFFATLLVGLGLFLFIRNSRLFNKRNKTLETEAEKTSAVTRDSILPKIHLKWLLPLGFLMGILSSYLGIGGGWLLVPILIYAFRVPPHIATATSIFSLCLYTSVGVLSQVFYSSIDWMTVIWGGVGVIIGSQLGVLVSQKIPGKLIVQLLSLLLLAIGFKMYFS